MQIWTYYPPSKSRVMLVTVASPKVTLISMRVLMKVILMTEVPKIVILLKVVCVKNMLRKLII
ncbi:hypothetical protein MHBO_004955 [Bonamia ostreae]|uniref:Uncharacterized protein n=1 Tax=Bonamia ostreae TaxID=126728 RepID=A0ABV2AUP4_9EUKA